MSETRYRIHMGCGEPLRSRGWIVRLLRQVPAAEAVDNRRGSARTSVGRTAARCKL